MKTLKLLSLIAVTALSLTTVKAQTADEVVNKHIEAIGGADNWKKVNSIVQTGSMVINGAEVAVVATILQNKGMRQDITLMGMNGYQILTAIEGWNFMPFQGQTTPEAMTADDVKESQTDLDVQGNLVDYKTKGHSVESLGKEDVDGTECFKLKIALKSGRSETLFFDAKTYNLVKAITVRKANGQEVEFATSFSNFQKLPEGIIIPMSISVPLGPGFNADLSILKVEVNKAIDESIFKPAK